MVEQFCCTNPEWFGFEDGNPLPGWLNKEGKPPLCPPSEYAVRWYIFIRFVLFDIYLLHLALNNFHFVMQTRVQMTSIFPQVING